MIATISDEQQQNQRIKIMKDELDLGFIAGTLSLK